MGPNKVKKITCQILFEVKQIFENFIYCKLISIFLDWVLGNNIKKPNQNQNQQQKETNISHLVKTPLLPLSLSQLYYQAQLISKYLSIPFIDSASLFAIDTCLLPLDPTTGYTQSLHQHSEQCVQLGQSSFILLLLPSHFFLIFQCGSCTVCIPSREFYVLLCSPLGLSLFGDLSVPEAWMMGSALACNGAVVELSGASCVQHHPSCSSQP